MTIARRTPASRRPAGRRDWWRGRSATVLGALALALVTSCQSDGLNPPSLVDDSRLYWALDLNHHAVTLSTTAPYDTLTLMATPRTVGRAPLSGLPMPQYVSSDPEHVIVTPAGVLRAIAPTSAGQFVAVAATLTAGNLKHVDTVLVRVEDNPAPPVLGSFSIHPSPPDSAKLAIGFTAGTCFELPSWTATPFLCRVLLPVDVSDITGAPIAGVPVAFRTSDPDHVWINADGQIGQDALHVEPGTVTIYASTTVFGVQKVDTLPFRLGFPLLQKIDFRAVLVQGGFPAELRIGTGGVVAWGTNDSELNLESAAVDITFADPTNVAAVDAAELVRLLGFFGLFFCTSPISCGQDGNIVIEGSLLNEPVNVNRRFPVPGVYEYHSTALNSGGRIVVVDER